MKWYALTICFIVFAIVVILLLLIKKIVSIVFKTTENIKNSNEAILDDTINNTGFAYDSVEDIFYSTLYPWQRKVGYCRLYDEAAAVMRMIIDSEPIRFEYNKKRWLIELWKGQYGMTTGCEIGIYNTDGADLHIEGVFDGTFYFCAKDSELLNMSYVLKKKGKQLFARRGRHWWLTGFRLGEFSKPKELSVDITIEFRDVFMCNKFVMALNEMGYDSKDIEIRNRSVIFEYRKPHSKQPITRTRLTDWWSQRKNKKWCKKYRKATKGVVGAQASMELLKNNNPKLYEQTMRIGRPVEAYTDFDSIFPHIKKR